MHLNICASFHRSNFTLVYILSHLITKVAFKVFFNRHTYKNTTFMAMLNIISSKIRGSVYAVMEKSIQYYIPCEFHKTASLRCSSHYLFVTCFYAHVWILSLHSMYTVEFSVKNISHNYGKIILVCIVYFLCWVTISIKFIPDI